MSSATPVIPIQLHPVGLTASYPGFLHDDYNRGGFFRPERLAKLIESMRGTMIRFQPILSQLLAPNRTMVVLTNHYHMLPQFIDLTAGRQTFPFVIRGTICNAGRSSFQLKQTLYKEGDMTNKLVTDTTTVVYLNRETRRPADLSENVKAAVGERKNNERHLAIPDKPSEAHCYEATIQPSDIDANMHTNQAVYVRLCSDCSMDAQSQSFYTGLGQITAHPVTEFQTYYQGESHEEDSLQVFTWQDQHNHYVIHFVITLKSKPIFYSRWLLGPKFKPLKAKY